MKTFGQFLIEKHMSDLGYTWRSTKAGSVGGARGGLIGGVTGSAMAGSTAGAAALAGLHGAATGSLTGAAIGAGLGAGRVASYKIAHKLKKSGHKKLARFVRDPLHLEKEETLHEFKIPTLPRKLQIRKNKQKTLFKTYGVDSTNKRKHSKRK